MNSGISIITDLAPEEKCLAKFSINSKVRRLSSAFVTVCSCIVWVLAMKIPVTMAMAMTRRSYGTNYGRFRLPRMADEEGSGSLVMENAGGVSILVCGVEERPART